MKITKIIFSPTGGTDKAASILAAGLGDEGQHINLADGAFSPADVTIASDEVCLIAVPSFGGRVPATATERLQSLQGNGAKSILMAVYGGREFEDTLTELQDTAEEAGFVPVAAVAALAEHSVSRKFCTGRPDAEDEAQLKEFSEKIKNRLEELSGVVPVERLEVPGDRPYKTYVASPARPLADESCTGCGICASVCPVGAIPAEEPSGMDTEKCIACMACEAACPAKARHIQPDFLNMLEGKLSAACAVGKENQLFL